MVEAVVSADVTSGLDAAFKAVGAVDGSSFIKWLLCKFRVVTELEGRGRIGCTAGIGVVVVGDAA